MSLVRAQAVVLSAVVTALLAGACGGGDGNADTDGSPGTDANAPDGGGGCPEPGALNQLTDQPDGRLEIGGQPGTVVAADASIEYPPGAPGGALAYTAVPQVDGAADQGGLHTRVALSDDEGASWTFFAFANDIESIDPPAGTCPAEADCTATRVHETSTIVYDAEDPDGDRRWKLITHRYPVVKVAGDPQARLFYALGHISMMTARVPSGPWSDPAPLATWPGGDGEGAAFSTDGDPATTRCGALGEPGAAVAPDGSLHLAVSCIEPPFEDPTLDIILLRSTDHGASWSYLSTPLSGADGACFGGAGKRVNAADLFTAGGVEYLIATPEAPDQRLGCAVIPFADPAAGTLDRTAGGPRAARLLTLEFARDELVHYAGACTAADGAPAAGFTMSHLDIRRGQPPAFHEVVSGIAAP